MYCISVPLRYQFLIGNNQLFLFICYVLIDVRTVFHCVFQFHYDVQAHMSAVYAISYGVPFIIALINILVTISYEGTNLNAYCALYFILQCTTFVLNFFVVRKMTKFKNSGLNSRALTFLSSPKVKVLF